MMASIAHIIWLVSGATLLCLTSFRPEWLGDSNSFLKNFINHEFLNVLGVILAITIASLAQIHLALNRIEERANRVYFESARAEIKSSARWLIFLFALGLALVISKPLVIMGETGAALANSAGILILIVYLLILWDITSSVFDIKSDVDRPDESADQESPPHG